MQPKDYPVNSMAYVFQPGEHEISHRWRASVHNCAFPDEKLVRNAAKT
jgi:hypothetical protein